MNPEEFDAIAQAHGGVVGRDVVDPYVENPTTGLKKPNEVPKYKITFRDGTAMTVRPKVSWNEQAKDWDYHGYEVTDAGTALKALKAPKAEDGTWTLKEVNGQTYRVNAKTGEATPVTSLPGKPTKAQEPQLLDKSGGEYITFLNPDGTLGQFEDPNWSSEWAVAHRQAQLNALNATAANAGASTAYNNAKLAWDKAQDPIKAAQEMEKARLQREAQDEQNRRTTAASLFSSLGSTWAQMAPRMVGANQVYHAGFEPGGVASQMARLTGSGFDPEAFRINRVTYDPQAQYTEAWQMANQGRPQVAPSPTATTPAAAPESNYVRPAYNMPPPELPSSRAAAASLVPTTAIPTAVTMPPRPDLDPGDAWRQVYGHGSPIEGTGLPTSPIAEMPTSRPDLDPGNAWRRIYGAPFISGTPRPPWINDVPGYLGGW